MAKQTQRRPATPPQQPARASQTGPAPRKTAPAPAPVRRTEKKSEGLFSGAADRTMLYGRRNFVLMGIGLGLVVLGLLLMIGGAMPDPTKWEPERIYSFQRITLAPILMVAGFVVVAFGIFKRTTVAEVTATAPATEE